MQPFLLVDDNDKYAELLSSYFKKHGFQFERAFDAREGWDLYQKNAPDYYPLIVTDVTMETQTSGLGMLKKIHRSGYQGTIIIASTGFDVIFAKTLTKLFLRSTGVHYMIPKTTVLSEAPVFYPIGFFEKPGSDFPGLVQA
ncbi:MAG: response regulator [Leptospiraceae bacterium]|nr:response regulator [Leptospiraceae bacterium]